MSAGDPTLRHVADLLAEAIEAALDAGMLLHAESRCSLCEDAAEDVGIVLARLREAQTNLRPMLAGVAAAHEAQAVPS